MEFACISIIRIHSYICIILFRLSPLHKPLEIFLINHFLKSVLKEHLTGFDKLSKRPIKAHRPPFAG